MERETSYFFVTIVLILVVNGTLLYVDHQGDKQLKQEFDARTAQMAQDLVTMQQQYDERISQHSVQLTQLDDKIETKTSAVKSELQEDVQDIQSSLKTVELKSEQKFSELESKLLKINVESADFTSVIRDSIDSVVSIQSDVGGGSGTIIDSKGYILTNYHVVAGASQIQVKTFKQKVYPVTFIGFNQKLDIAVLKISDNSFDAVKWGDSSKMSIGEKVIAIGSPGGLDFTVTEGIVSAKRKDSKGVNYLQIDVPINPGNSGGPLLNREGRLIGVTQIKISEFEGIGFAITSNDVDDVVRGIIQEAENDE